MQKREPRRSTRGIYRFTLDFREFLREIEICGNGTGDQPCAAAKSQILHRPLNENEDATLKRNQIGNMDKSPNQPCQEPRNVETENIGHRRCTSNHRQSPFVEVRKGRKFPLTLYFSYDRLGCIGSS